MIANDMRHALPIRAVQALVLCILLSLSGVAFAAEDLVAPVPLSDFGSAWTYEIGQAGGSLSEVEERLQAQEARPAPFIGVHDGDKKDKNTKNKKRAKDDKKARDEETRFELDKDWVFDESSESSLANRILASAKVGSTSIAVRNADSASDSWSASSLRMPW